jgi:hypothetical protein
MAKGNRIITVTGASGFGGLAIFTIRGSIVEIGVKLSHSLHHSI